MRTVMMCRTSSISRIAEMTMLLLAAWAAMAPSPSRGQIVTGCTRALIASFTPCLSYITGSTNGEGKSPTAACCKSVRSLLSDAADCGCLIVTGNVPFSLPINRTLAISLPSACNSSSVPIFQCKGSATPLAPGPVAFGPSLPPLSSDAGDSDQAPSAPALPPFREAPNSSSSSPPSTPSTPSSTTTPTPVTSADSPTAEALKPLLFPSAAPPVFPCTTAVFAQSLLLLLLTATVILNLL